MTDEEEQLSEVVSTLNYTSSKVDTTAWTEGVGTNLSTTTEFGLSVWVGSWSEEGQAIENGQIKLIRATVVTHTHWLQYPPLRPEFHYLLGTLLVIIGTAGVLGNGLVLFVFTRFRRLRGPASSFIVNLAVADLCNSLLHSMAAASSFRRAWAFGNAGCVVYACGVGYFGLLSIVTLAAIAVERYMVITAKPLSGNWKMTKYGARKVCVVVWFYCALMCAPPLFGWSRYVAEGFLTSCSWDYLSRTPANRSYYIYLLSLGFVVPVCVIAYCYAFILAAIRAHGKEMAAVKGMMTGGSPPSFGSNVSGGMGMNCRSHYHYHSNHHSPHHHNHGQRLAQRHGSSNTSATATTSHPHHMRSASHRSGARSSNAVRTAEVILTLILLFLISWTPYSVISLIGQFGDMQKITPWTATLPAIFAKASVIYNPIVYGLSHPHFRSSVRQYLSACTTAASAGHMTTASLMRRHSPQAPMKKKVEAAATIAEAASPPPSVASAPAAAVMLSEADIDPDFKRRMGIPLQHCKHRRRRKHRSGSNSPSSRGKLHHVHFRYHSGEFLSEPDNHHVTLLMEKSTKDSAECFINPGPVQENGAKRLTVSHGGDDRDRLNKDDVPLECKGVRRSSCSRAVCVMHDGSHVCRLSGREAGKLFAQDRKESTSSKSQWEMSSLL
uniref:Arthropsin protein n=1 Tax=Indolestes peregrinus TaxID=546916 RepID=A0A0C6FPZ7_9ODON|nr:opsin, arthropsin type [Indolestes peregrinus]